MVVRIGLLITLLCLSLNASAKGFTAQVDRLSVGLSDHIQLVLTLEDIQGDRPDTSVLNKDFTILQRSQSSNLKVINGIVSQEVRWVFLLSPKRKGTLTVPAFISGSYKSLPINIEVGDVPVDQSTSDTVLLEVEVRPLNPYVKGQAIYTQRLYFSRQLVDNASLEKPKLTEGDAEIIFLGSSNPRYVKRNGKPYQLIERYYSVFPNSAGELLFAPSVFRGSVSADGQQSRSSRFLFNTGKRVTAYSSKATLSISDQPVEFTGQHWLPTSQLSLDMNWSQPPETLKAGEPVTVTIMLMAEGLKAETLPEVMLKWPESIKTYPEKPEFRTDKQASGVVGLRQEKVVLVANQAGEFQIPTIEVPWWNTITNQQQVERIGGFVVKVVGGAVIHKAPLVETTSAKPEEEIRENKDDIEEGKLVANEHSFTDWLMTFYSNNKRSLLVTLAFSIVFLVFLVCLICLYIYIYKSKKTDAKKRQEFSLIAIDLEKACRSNDSIVAIAILPKWANAVGICPATLAGIKTCGNVQLESAVTVLLQVSYSKAPQAWEGQKLLKAVNEFSHDEKTGSLSDSLGSLHPLH